MAVFTSVSLDELNHWIRRYELGPASKIEGISSGIENSNFFVSFAHQPTQWVLTLFEKLQAEQLPFYLNFMTHLADKGLPVPRPLPARDGTLFSILNQRPAVLIAKLSGASNLTPDASTCAQMGACLAKMHLASTDYSGVLENPRNLVWSKAIAPHVVPYLTPSQLRLLTTELDLQIASADRLADLPRGAVHLDIFRDNVMFLDRQLTGVFDFYFAGVAAYVYDLAIAVNDWCLAPSRDHFDPERVKAFVDAYDAIRPLNKTEQNVWPIVLRGAALRFWLSRLYDFHQPRNASMLTPHDPTHFERLLRIHAGIHAETHAQAAPCASVSSATPTQYFIQ